MARAKPLIAGNWKMNGTKQQLAELEALKIGLRDRQGVDIAVCPPATLLSRASVMLAASRVMIGGQDCHPLAAGAHTGDISAEMLADAGASLVIVGHSERRSSHAENDKLVRAKTEAVWRARLLAILCVGETESERRAGEAESTVGRQLDGSVPDGATEANLVIAYEPVWAIGTGQTATPDDIAGMHRHIRSRLVSRFGVVGEGIGILYGGSVNPENAGSILSLPGVDGALVGGASLKASTFIPIVEALG